MKKLTRNKKIGLVALTGVLVFSAMLGIACSCGKGNKDNFNYTVTGTVSYYKTEMDYISPSDVAVSNNYAFVSDATRNKVYKVNLLNNEIAATYSSSKPVNTVTVDGTDVYVGAGELAGDLIKLSSANLAEIKRVDADHTPNDIVINGDYIYVANRFSNTVGVYKKADMTKVTSIATAREPMAMAVTNGYMYVACHLADDAATSDIVSSKLTIINLADNELFTNLPLINGTSSVKDVCVSSDGRYVYVSGLFSRYSYSTTQLQYGWINTNGITIIDSDNNQVVAGVLLDDPESGAANPWGVRAADNKLVCSISGLNQLMIVDEEAMLQKVNAIVDTGTEDEILRITDDLAFLSGIKDRISLKGEGARRVEVSNGTAYICQYFTGGLESLNINTYESEIISLGTNPKPDAVRLGELMWYDATQCYQEWESCASCHPDARTDGLNWDNLNDGLGNSKQTRTMMYSHRTPPVMVTGARDSAELAVQKGMFFIQFNTVPQSQLDNIDAFLKSLTPVQSPYLNRDGTLSESAKRGQKLYEEYNCAACHSGPNFTDLKLYTSPALGTDGTWENRKMVTSSFVEIWRTAPYTFNGSAKTMKDAVKVYKPGITDSNAEDLANYILSLGNEGEYYGVEQVLFQNADKNTVINKLQESNNLFAITIRKQKETSSDAIVRFALCNASGKQIGSGATATLNGQMVVGDYAKISLEMKMPSTLSEGDYYRITIVDGKGNPLSSVYTYKFTEEA